MIALIKRIHSWLVQRRLRAAKDRFDRGFDTAAGALLRGKAAEEVGTWIDDVFDPNEFDDGLAAALVAWDNVISDSLPEPQWAATQPEKSSPPYYIAA